MGDQVRRRPPSYADDPAGGVSPAPYPWLADVLITLPWLLDVLGNRLDLFDSVTWWDDLMHFVNWALLTADVLLVAAPAGASAGLLVMLALGFGTTAAVGWEIGEYDAFIRDSPSCRAPTPTRWATSVWAAWAHCWPALRCGWFVRASERADATGST